MKNVFRACFAALLAYVLSMAAPQTGTSLKTFRESSFTAEQASRGEQVYAARCSQCHGDNLLGMEMAPALTGVTFRKAWETQPLLTLANRIKATMPPTAPNSLSASQHTDLMSFILKANGISPGNTVLSFPDSGAISTAASVPPGKVSGPLTELTWRTRATRPWIRSTRAISGNCRLHGA